MLVVAAAGLMGLGAGCGGGDDDNGSVARTVAGHTITDPTVATSTTSSTNENSSTTVPSTITLPSGERIQTSDLTPFRDCLRRHGVEPLPLDRGPSGFGELTPDRIKQLKAQIQARVACAPQLPPPLRRAFERYRRWLQERRQGG
jgi:hypothetical protein